MFTGLRFRWISMLALAALLLGTFAPVVTQPALAQTDELTQNDFDDLLDEAEENDPIYGPEDGALEHDPDIITLAYAEVDVTNFVAYAEFTNPADADDAPFDIGIQFRIAAQNDEPINIRFIVLSSGDWGVAETGVDDLLASGSYDDFETGEGDQNDLTVIAEDEWVHLGINGDYVGSAEVGFEISGDVAVGTAFLAESYIDGAETEFSDFTVWSDEGGSSNGNKDDNQDENGNNGQDDPDNQTSGDGTLYEAEVFTFSFTYGDEWELSEPSQTENVEFIPLSNGTSNLQVVVGNLWEDQPECVESLLGVILSTLESNDVTGEVTQLTDLEELDDHPFVGTYGAEFEFEADTGSDFPDSTIYIECGPADTNEYLVGVIHLVPSDAYEDEIPAREAIVATFNQGDDGLTDEEVDEETPEPDDNGNEDQNQNGNEGQDEGVRFEADFYDFFATVPDGWEVTSTFTTDTDPPFEIINLGDETSVVQIILGPFNLDDPEACISTIVGLTVSNLESAEITGELSGGDLDSIGGGATAATFTYTPDGDFPELTIYAQCGPSGEDDYAIGLTQWAPASIYEDSVPGREQLVESFNQEEQVEPDPDDDDDKPTREADSGDNLTANVEPGEDGLRIYTSPTFGLTVGILPGFTIEEDSVANGYDTLVVADSVGRATYSIFNSSNTPVGCLSSIENNLNSDQSIAQVQIATDENGVELRETGDGYSMFAVYLTFSNGLELGRLYACVGDPSINTMLVFAYETSAEDFPDEVENAIIMIELIGIEQ